MHQPITQTDELLDTLDDLRQEKVDQLRSCGANALRQWIDDESTLETALRFWFDLRDAIRRGDPSILATVDIQHRQLLEEIAERLVDITDAEERLAEIEAERERDRKATEADHWVDDHGLVAYA